MIVNLWRYKKYIYKSAVDDLRHRYAGSAMGIFWNVISPLAQIAIFTFVFSKLMNVRLPGMNESAGFVIYICAGLLPWTAFSECISRGAAAFTSNSNYLKKLPIPEQVFVAQTAMSATLSLVISMSLLFLMNLFMGTGIGWQWLLVPLVLILFQAFGFGIGLILSSLNVFFSDIGQILPVFLQLWMWLTPIVYLKDILPERFMGLMMMNPAFVFIDALQACIVYRRWPPVWEWGVMALYASITSMIGYLILRKLRSELRDMI